MQAPLLGLSQHQLPTTALLLCCCAASEGVELKQALNVHCWSPVVGQRYPAVHIRRGIATQANACARRAPAIMDVNHCKALTDRPHRRWLVEK